MSAGVVSVRPFEVSDLEAAARFCDAARARDPFIEPFAQRLGLIATGPRADLSLWQVAAGEEGTLVGIAFAALREAEQRLFDVYLAVDPALRRQGLGRALAEAALNANVSLRARVRDDSRAGRAFLAACGFLETGAQLSLQWSAHALHLPPLPALRIRPATERDAAVLARLATDAWAGAPESFPSRADELNQLFAEEGRLLLIAESEGKPMGYLSAVHLGRTLGIEEVAVLPEFRRMGVGAALVGRALAKAPQAVLSVSESNKAARALYRSLGFVQGARRLIYLRSAP